MDNQNTAGVDLDKLPRYSVGVERCTMDRDDYEGEYVKLADVRELLARRAEPSVTEAPSDGLIYEAVSRRADPKGHAEAMAQIDEVLGRAALASPYEQSWKQIVSILSRLDDALIWSDEEKTKERIRIVVELVKDLASPAVAEKSGFIRARAEVVEAFKNGATIQSRAPGWDWEDDTRPDWTERGVQWRVKPGDSASSAVSQQAAPEATTDKIWKAEVARLERELVVAKRGNEMLLAENERLAAAPAVSQKDGAADDEECKRCGGEAMIYVEDATTPCPDCQDLSDYDEVSPSAIGCNDASPAATTATGSIDGQLTGAPSAVKQAATTASASKIACSSCGLTMEESHWLASHRTQESSQKAVPLPGEVAEALSDLADEALANGNSQDVVDEMVNVIRAALAQQGAPSRDAAPVKRPSLPAPTRMHYGLHYRAEDMEAYGEACAAFALAQQGASHVCQSGGKCDHSNHCSDCPYAAPSWDHEEAHDSRAPAPSLDATPVGPSLREVTLAIVKRLGWTINGTFVITKSGDELHTADAIAFVHAALARAPLPAQGEKEFDHGEFMRLVREFAEVVYGVRRTTEDVGANLVNYVKSLAAPAQAGDVRDDFAVRFIEQRAQQYLQDHADTEPDTGALVFEFGEAGREYHSTLIELADDLRAAMSASQGHQNSGSDQ
jgi:hypothetical protein